MSGLSHPKCPWCRVLVQLPRGYRPRRDTKIDLLRCDCGAVALASLDSEADWPRVVEGVLGRPREEWPEPTWGLRQIERWTQHDWGRIQQGEELPPDVDCLFYPLLWGRRSESDRGKAK